MSSNWQSRVIKAKAGLVMQSPFFGSLVLQMEHVEHKEIQTMATDGVKLFVNPEYVDTLLDDELVCILAHETMHCALNHHVRMGNRDLETWNKAADYAINNELKKAGFTIPKGFLVDSQFDGKSVEEIYSILDQKKQDNQKQNQKPQNKPGNKPGQGAGQGNGQGKPDLGQGGILKPGNGSQSAIAEATAQQAIKNQQAATFAKSANAGNLPESIARLLKEAKPEIDWREILRQFISDCSNRDYSFSRPNKQYLPFEMIMPSLIPNGINRLVFAVDTSGSIDANLLNRFAAEMRDAAQAVAIDNITVIFCDAAIQGIEEYAANEDMTLKPKGGGGTMFSPVFKKIADDYQDATAIVFFTDLICSDFGPEPHCPTLWAQWGNYKTDHVPFGEVMKVAAYN